MSNTPSAPLLSQRGKSLTGAITIPGDKSISHRALMLSGMAIGKTRISGLLEGEDVLNTAKAMQALGVESGRTADGAWWVNGVGVGGLAAPATVMDMGNSGTSTRLLMGLVGSYGFTSRFTGDASLCKRPMARVMTPLELMGVNFESAEGGRLPLAVIGTDMAVPITYRLPVASAQVKSAILLCGLNAPGVTTVIEPHATRDHSETMLRHFGAKVESRMENGETIIHLTGQPDLRAKDIVVPGDPSSAAFPVIAALINEGSDLTVRHVCLNPLRTGVYETLREMGADITFENPRVEAGEKVADIHVRASRLKGIRVPADRAPSMIDEYPVLAVAAAFAEGSTVMEGLDELRVKESDRLAMIAEGLAACGVKLEVSGNTLTVHGNGRPPKGGTKIATAMDHRIAMSFLVMGTAAADAVAIDDGAFIATSFPRFTDLMNSLGARITHAA
jgi:3-phosphoshikimate 1-carboxyvinyltransferase